MSKGKDSDFNDFLNKLASKIKNAEKLARLLEYFRVSKVIYNYNHSKAEIAQREE